MANDQDQSLLTFPTTTTLAAHGADVKAVIASRPLATVGILSAGFQAIAAARMYGALGPGEWPVLRDSVNFEYIGWYLTTGRRLYIDIWELKPPLAFELPAILAYLAGDHVAFYHTLNLAVTSGALIGGAVVAGAIVDDRTGDPLATVVGGLTVFVLPAYYWRALIGFKAKYFVVFCGLLSLWLLLRDRPVLAGTASTAAVGFWQVAIVYPVVCVIRYAIDRDWRGAKRFVLASLGTGVIILLPVIVWGAVPAMIAHTILGPLLIDTPESSVSRVQLMLSLLGVTIPILLFGLAAYAGSLTSAHRGREWPLVAAALWFTLVVVFVDFDYYPDLFPLFSLIAVGVGIGIGRGTGPTRRFVSAMVLGLVLLSVATMGGLGYGTPALPAVEVYNTAVEVDPVAPYNRVERQYLYWNRDLVSTCWAFAGKPEVELIETAGLAGPDTSYWEAECGQFDPIWSAVVDKYTP